MFVRYPPGKIRYEGDRPAALLGVRVAASQFGLVDLPLGLPTTLARSSRGTWALYSLGAEVVVVHPDGAVSGPPAEVATEVGRLADHDQQGELDRQAARAIQHLLTGDGPDRAGRRRVRTRTWSVPARAYWISGPYNYHEHPAAEAVGHSGRRHSVDRGMGGPTIHAGSPPGRSQPPGSQRPRVRGRRASNPTRSPLHRRAAATSRNGGREAS